MTALAHDIQMADAARVPRATELHRKRERAARAEAREYVFYSVLLLPLAIAAVTIRRMLKRSRRSAAVRGSFFAEVMEFNRSTVPWIFKGW